MIPFAARTRLRSLLLLASLGVSSVAQASSPNAIYVVASRIDLMPDAKNATSAIIHGAFFFWMNGGAYSAPTCGYMYFSCPQGAEAMCRQQWTDVATFSQNGACAGFGPINVMTNATFYKEGAVPGKPDLWDNGMGVAPGGFVGGQCQPALMLKCPLAGPADMAMPPVDMSLVGKPDLAGGAPDLASTPRDMAMVSPADLAMPAPADLAVSPPKPDLAVTPAVVSPGCTCGLGGRSASPPSLVLLVGLLGLALRRRTRG